VNQHSSEFKTKHNWIIFGRLEQPEALHTK
jgi:hypothetical protein